MGEVVRMLNQPWLGSVLGIAGLLVAIVIYQVTKVRASLAYTVTSAKLIGKDDGDLPDDVIIHYKGREVFSLFRTEVVIWNAGTQLIRGSDIVKDDALRICVDAETEILSSQVTRVTRKVNSFKAAAIRSVVLCAFDYLDPRDGALVEIIHTSADAVVVRGTIRGIPSGPDDCTQDCVGPMDYISLDRLTLLAVIVWIGASWLLWFDAKNAADYIPIALTGIFVISTLINIWRRRKKQGPPVLTRCH